MVTPLPDIVGDNAVHQFSATTLAASEVQVIVTGSGTVRLGSNITQPNSGLGLPIPAGGGYFYPVRDPRWSKPYDLSQGYAYVPTGATLSIAYEPAF